MMARIKRTQSAETAESILDAATELFANKGFDGARVDELAAVAGVNKATLYYQLGDKEAIYHAVLTRVLRRTADDVCNAVKRADKCEEKLRQYINLFARQAGNMRHAAPIMLREIASGGSNMPDTAIEQMGRLLGALGEALREGERLGKFRPVNKFMVHTMIAGSLLLYASNEPIRRRNVERHPEVYDPTFFISSDEAAAAITDLVLAAITTPAEGN